MPRRRAFPLGFGIALALALYAGWTFAAPNVRTHLPPEQLELVLASDKPVYAIGEQPKITATLTNRSGQTIALVPALDGSDSGRYPLVKFTVAAPPDALPEVQYGRCGNTNPLLVTDFTIVQANERFDVYGEWGGPSPTALDRGPGEYTIQLIYSTDDPDVNAWHGGPLTPTQQKVAQLKFGALLGKVPRFTVTSNVLKIRFENPFSNIEEMLRKGTIEQSSFALRMISTEHASENLPAVLVEAIARFGDASNPGNRAFRMEALKRFQPLAKPSDADMLWQVVSDSISATGMGDSYWIDDYDLREPLVNAVLISPDDRDERLIELFCVRTITHGGSPSQRRPMQLTPELMKIISEVPGEDIGNALLAMHDDAIEHKNIDTRVFESLREELRSRKLLASHIVQ
ncbi:MAG: hypothetical protein SGI88_10130 [Candidatus Hydrogenedentes bacterium]|nr:hypothetical protein [Candidatus Hydrogenedentota bacterium]